MYIIFKSLMLLLKNSITFRMTFTNMEALYLFLVLLPGVLHVALVLRPQRAKLRLLLRPQLRLPLRIVVPQLNNNKSTKL